jgi:hypothetical protein
VEQIAALDAAQGWYVEARIAEQLKFETFWTACMLTCHPATRLRESKKRPWLASSKNCAGTIPRRDRLGTFPAQQGTPASHPHRRRGPKVGHQYLD